MGVKVVLAPRNSAEGVALGVSACFLAVAAFVATSDGTTATTQVDTFVAAPASATLDRPRTYSRPPTGSQVFGARVVETDPPLVMLPVRDQAKAKLEAAGTLRGAGVTLVTVSRGQGVLALGGAVAGGGTGTTAAPVLIPTSPVSTPTTPAATPTTPPATPPSTPPSTPSTPPTTPVTPPPTTPTDPPTTPVDPPPTGESGTGGTDGTGSSGGSSGGTGGGTNAGTDAGTTTGGTLDSGTSAGTTSGTTDAGLSSAPTD